MGKSTKKEQKKATTEIVPALVLAKDNEVKGKVLPAGTVIFIGECAEGLTIHDVHKAIARGNVKAEEAEIAFADTGVGGEGQGAGDDGGNDKSEAGDGGSE